MTAITRPDALARMPVSLFSGLGSSVAGVVERETELIHTDSTTVQKARQIGPARLFEIEGDHAQARANPIPSVIAHAAVFGLFTRALFRRVFHACSKVNYE